jgi:hypothetical protein
VIPIHRFYGFARIFSGWKLVGVEELNEDYEDDDGEEGEKGDSYFYPEAESRDSAFECLEAVAVLFDGEAGSLDVFGELGDDCVLILQLAVEASVGLDYLTEIAANAFSHGYHGGFGGLLGCGAGGKVPVGHGDETGDVGEEFEELGYELGPHIRPS